MTMIATPQHELNRRASDGDGDNDAGMNAQNMVLLESSESPAGREWPAG